MESTSDNSQPTKPLTRRALITGSAPRGASPAEAPPNLPPTGELRSEIRQAEHFVSYVRRAMACDFVVRLDARPGRSEAAAALRALDLVEKLEDQMTIYRDASEVIDINRQAAHRDVPVEGRLFHLLELAAELYTETAGALDITVGPLSRTWGFSRRDGRLPAQDEIDDALAHVGFHHVELNRASTTVRFRQVGTEINFNSLGKGYALDRAAECLDETGMTNYLLQGGKSSILARGDDGCTPGGGWRVGIRHPLWPKRRLGELRLMQTALGTAGSATQFFRHRGRRYGHILDPRTGRPAQGVYSATVVAPTAAAADALATAFYVMGPDATKEYCSTHPDIGAILVIPTSQEGDVELACCGLDSDQWLRCDVEEGPHNAHRD